MVFYKSQFSAAAFRLFFISILLLLQYSSLFGQKVINNGGNIIITSGGNFIIGDSYTNLFSGDNGKVDIDGDMIVFGNWINNAANNVFVNIDPVPDGDVILEGSTPQSVGGTSPTYFENLSLTNSIKTLNITGCKVNGILSLDALLDLNSKKIILANNSPSAINYISKYILSETPPASGYGEVQWNIGNSVNTYSIPFGSGNASDNDLNLTLSTTSAGNPSDGNISFATYPSDCGNTPLPSGVASLGHEASYVADRYWIINPGYSTSKPDIEIIFKYSSGDVDMCNNNIDQSKLKAIRYNTSFMTWDDLNPNGVADENAKTVSTTEISNNNFYAPWTLLSEEIPESFYMPDAFTPNGDGLNDLFYAKYSTLEQYGFKMYIFDRWGQKIFETNDINKGWDGKVNGGSKIAQTGVYTWLVELTDLQGNVTKHNGRVTLLK